jgi:uncharacterized protein
MLHRLVLSLAVVMTISLGPQAPLGARRAAANSTAQPLPFSQNWTITSQITADDDWAGVPGIVGYRGDGLTAEQGADPQEVLDDGTSTPVDVIANLGASVSNTSGGVGEFDGLADRVVALQGSGTADAPFLLLNLDTTGLTQVVVAYTLRDIDSSDDDAVQRVALHYRVGSSGSFTNLPGGYVADASTGPSQATLVTPVSVMLPSAADNQPLVQVRILTTDAAGNDEWIGVDDLLVTGAHSLVITKTAPARVYPGSLFTYTLTITNLAGLALTNLVITDSVPVSTSLAYAGDGGALAGDTISWTVPSLADLSAVSVSFAVTATSALTTVVNDRYGVQAGNYLTPAVGGGVRTVVSDRLRIHDVQGAGHRSAYAGQDVTGLVGVVTAVDSGGYYLQDPEPDDDPATSEAIFVDTIGGAGHSVGELLVISGTVSERYPGGLGAGGLSVTQLNPTFTVVISATGQALPPPVVLGSGGRVPPNMVIDDDATGNVETSGSFDAGSDGIDFWESLETMRVQVNDALVVASTRAGGDLTVVGDGGANAGLLSPRSVLVVRAGDANPERLIMDNGLLATPVINAGAYFTAPIVGVLDYSAGNFRLQATSLPAPQPSALISETTTLTRTAAQLTVATFNVENLGPGDPPEKFAALADRIVNHLLAPDLIALEEMQDNSGATNDGVVAADLTFGALISAVAAAGGPTYEYRQIDPVNLQDGGAPGGNIRVGFLFRTDRGLSFVDRPGGTATSSTSVGLGADGPQLSFSPGRVSPTNGAFAGSRKPLAGEFVFNGVKLFVIANHWNSKGGDDALMGRFQPPTLSSETQRKQQAQVVHDFVAALLALDPQANVVVLGDLNDFAYSAPLATLTAGGGLTPLISTLPETERYSYVFEGNAQALDHILLSPQLMASGFAGFDVVHVNAEFIDAQRASDHDPSLVRLAPLAALRWLYLPLALRP